MKEIIGVCQNIAAPADKVWKVLAAISGVDKWAPMITSCRVEGSGAGAKRFCTMGDGIKLNEVIDEVDHAAMRLRYRITEGLPVEAIEGTMSVKAVDGKTSEVTWYSKYASSPENAAMMRDMLREAYTASLKGLEKYCQH